MNKINRQALHALFSRKFKEMFGKGAQEIQIEIYDDRIEINIQFMFNHIEEQLIKTQRGKRIVKEKANMEVSGDSSQG